jgi:hypothetical protein
MDRARVRQLIAQSCDDIKEMLLAKNEAYGNSVLEPINVFYKGSPLDGARVRLDDKLKRIQNGAEAVGEDTVLDLIGYLVLYRVGKEMGL